MRRGTAALAVVMMCAIGACGGTESGSPVEPGGTSAAPDPDDGDAGTAFAPCTSITDEEITAIVGYDVVKQDTGNSCIWGNPDEPRSPSVAVNNPMPSGGGGIESSKAGTQAVLNGEVVEVSGVGEAAYLIVGTGKTFAKDSVQAQGVIQSGDTLILVGITQLGSSTEAEVDTLARKAMELVGSKL